jgi:two-component system, cell cycle sensor histidine kinase and response regulator CckA
MTSRPEPRSAAASRADAALEAARDESARLRSELVKISAERERLRAELSDARVLEAVGRLAAGVAHDFSNLVTVIAGHSGVLLRLIAPGDPLRESVEGIQGAAEWGTRLTRQLLAASRHQESPSAVVDVNDVVAGADAMLRLLVGAANELQTRLDPGPCPVRMSLGRMEQVITNLVANAREASPDGGRVTIATAKTDVDDARAAALGLPGAGRYVVLSVSDTGSGMDDDTQARVFERNFTTKGPGQRGLGLSTVQDVVARSGGAVGVTSRAGLGSTFEVFLPAHAAPDPARAQTLEGTETVLVVEDERPVRELIRDVLRLHGYTVLEARDGDEAIAIGERHAGPVHLVLLDVVTPGAPMAAVVDRLRAGNPALRQLYMSGHSGEMLRGRGMARIGPDFLQKPFTVDTLARKVRDILDRP